MAEEAVMAEETMSEYPRTVTYLPGRERYCPGCGTLVVLTLVRIGGYGSSTGKPGYHATHRCPNHWSVGLEGRAWWVRWRAEWRAFWHETDHDCGATYLETGEFDYGPDGVRR